VPLLVVGVRLPPTLGSSTPGQLRAAGGTIGDAVQVSGAPELDELYRQALGSPGAPRLVIDADLAGLNLALQRLMRAGLLASTETAVITRARVGYLTRCGLPADRADQAAIAVHGQARLVGVVKDDSGGLSVDGATLTPFSGTADSRGDWWVRAVVDDQPLVDGPARQIEFHRLGPTELSATARTGRWRAQRRTGRSLQLACDPAQIVADGVPRERPRSKRTFWSEPELWRLALPD
jgi:hypothetical protein